MKGKSTVRHEVKRLDSKKVRAAERTALEGGNPRLVRTGGWRGREDRQPPILDDVSMRGKQKRESKSITYCPSRQHEGNKRHYYIEKQEVIESSHWDGTPYTYTDKWKECMYCRKGTRHRWRWWRYR